MKCPLLSRCLLVILIQSYVELSWSQTATAPVDPSGQGTLSFVHTPTKLPFHLYWGYLVVVEGSIGNVQKLNFLVDTGAYPSIVDQRLADMRCSPSFGPKCSLLKVDRCLQYSIDRSLLLGLWEL